MQAADPQLHTFVVCGFLIAFALAFGIGANDVANSFGTSVGSKVLTLRQACILASVFEILGAILIGGRVSATIREGIMDPLLFRGKEKEYCLGLVASLAGCCIWMLLATFFKLPVSGTHSIVGSTMGFALVSKGSSSIQWKHFAKIVASWFISPLLSGFISVLVFLFIRRFILQDPNLAFSRTLRWLPVFYCVTILINVLSVLLCGPSLFWFDRIPLWAKLVIVSLVGFFTLIVVQFIFRPRILKQISRKRNRNDAIMTTTVFSSKVPDKCQEMSPLTVQSNIEQSFPSKGKADSSRSLESETRIFTVEPTVAETQDAQVQVDYIALLNDRAIPIFDQWPQLGFVPYIAVSGFGDPTRLNNLRDISYGSTGAEHAYATYRHSRERYKSMPRFGPNRRIFNKTNQITDNIDNFTSPEIPHVIFDSHAVSRSTQPISPMIRSISLVDSDTDDSEPDEIEQRVRYIDSVKSQHKRDDEIADSVEVGKLFSFLQIMTAVFGSFAHGGNDVSNAIGPLISLWLVFAEGTVKSSKSPLWVLFYGGVGIIVGLWIWGRRVIKTIGEDLTKITPSVGFVIEVSTAFTVLFASNLSIPVSTTHCKVGSVVFTGRIRSKQSVDWSLFGNIIIAWLVTVPVTGILSAALTALFRNLVI